MANDDEFVDLGKEGVAKPKPTQKPINNENLNKSEPVKSSGPLKFTTSKKPQHLDTIGAQPLTTSDPLPGEPKKDEGESMKFKSEAPKFKNNKVESGNNFKQIETKEEKVKCRSPLENLKPLKQKATAASAGDPSATTKAT